MPSRLTVRVSSSLTLSTTVFVPTLAIPAAKVKVTQLQVSRRAVVVVTEDLQDYHSHGRRWTIAGSTVMLSVAARRASRWKRRG
jgi:hypothetical protein